ncbi:hypothetical protein GWK47_018109 [Chionoecetes opilio]|uniref:Uncharacterized protein n=1 Tax=Chionoecetes opilio TaxID=41210 RepID=A0A8J5BY46_CHIOP|nr:hypothetical protein GWK47_018109 [Chionoecetes opilio]
MEASSNWVVESVLELQDAIQESTTFPSEDPAEVLDEEKCFSLTRPDEGEGTDGGDWCHIRVSGRHAIGTLPWAAQAGPPFSAGNGKLIKGLLVHSEARVLEVCVGPHDEYLKTVHGKRLGQYEDTEMCVCEVQIEPPRREVLMTLKHTYNLDCVWVFGLHVVTTEEPAKCGESRFSGDHLSSVLKEKEVNVSKDATRFLHMLESYSAANHGSKHVNENNQLALMSMFLGPKMLNTDSCGPGMLGKIHGIEGKRDTVMHSKLKTEKNDTLGSESIKDISAMSRTTDVDKVNSNDVENKMKKLKINGKEMNKDYISKELANVGNNNTSSNSYKESITSKTQAAGNQDRLLENVFNLLGNVGHGLKEQQETQEHHSNTKGETSPPPALPHDHHSNTKAETSLSPASPHEHLRPPASPHDHHRPPASSLLGLTTPGRHTMHTLMQSLSRIAPPVNNFHPSHCAGGGPAHSTPRATTSGNNTMWPLDGGCNGLSLEGSGPLLKEIENMIDKKFVQMEERLVQRIEQKMTEKAKSDSEKLDKIEEHLSKLCEHLGHR